jgi:4-amino-4-deoxy-L-arabinose transferase-like glycosyltransferase
MLAQAGRFQPDEALYAGFARRISLHGDFLLQDAPLDKPPLALVVTAAFFSIFGPTEFAARLPAFFASSLTLATAGALAKRLYGGRTGLALIVILLLALSPLDLAFAATAFFDPLLTACLLLACLAASHDRWRASGAAFAASIAIKQSALFFAPLILLIGFGCTVQRSWRWPDLWRRLRRFVVPVMLGGLLLAVWSMARAAPVDFWTLGVYNNNPGRLIRANEMLPRLARWLYLLGYVTGFSPLLVMACVSLLGGWRRVRRDVLIDVILAAVVLAMLLAYWLIAFNTYDRYLHPLGPLILLLVARGLSRLGRPATLLAIVCMLPVTASALRGQVDIGGDHRQYAGITRLAEAVNSLPAGAVVYDYALGWELSYYLGDQPAVHVVYEPSPQALARAACGGTTRSYFVTPAEAAKAWLAPVRDHKASIAVLVDGPLELFQIDCPPDQQGP